MLRHVNLAQVNLSRLRFPADSPELAEFVAALDRLNRVAEQAPGFVWRLPGEHLNGGALLGDPLVVVNVSVWESYPALHAYVYRSRHGHYLRRRAEWFEQLPSPTTALWWTPAGHEPTVEEALTRLTHLRRNGPTRHAFTVRTRYTPTGHRESKGGRTRDSQVLSPGTLFRTPPRAPVGI